MVADPDYLRSLIDMMRALADDCFDRNASTQLRMLADKIDHDITLGLIIMRKLDDNHNGKNKL
jgi:hypothetical protein